MTCYRFAGTSSMCVSGEEMERHSEKRHELMAQFDHSLHVSDQMKIFLRSSVLHFSFFRNATKSFHCLRSLIGCSMNVNERLPDSAASV